MVVKLNIASQLKFFYDVLGKEFTDANVKPLVEQGTVINVEFTRLTATVAGTKQQLDLPASTTVLMKGAASPELATMASVKIKEWIGTLHKIAHQGTAHATLAAGGPTMVTFGGGGSGGIAAGGGGAAGTAGTGGSGTMGAAGGGGGVWGTGVASGSAPNVTVNVQVEPAAPAEPDYLVELAKATGLSADVVDTLKTQLGHAPMGADTKELLKHAALHAEPFVAKTVEPPPAPKKKPAKPTTKSVSVINLRDATDIGQRVNGTSAGSVYTVIALNDTVKIAARVMGVKISIRAEFSKPEYDNELNSLASMGLSLSNGPHGSYMSAHMQADDCSPGRVIGAFLFDCGIEFTHQMHNFKGLQHADHH
jgi:hypothetical protein